MSTPSPIQGKVALITGGLGGIAVSYAKHLMCNGIKGIVLVDKEDKKAKKILHELEDAGKGDVCFMKADIRCEKNIKDAFEATVGKFNQLDMFINHAGIMDEGMWREMIKTNFNASVKGIHMAVKEYLPKYKSSEDPVVVHTSCVTALQPLQSVAAYSSTKCGMMGFYRALSAEHWHKQHKCRFLAICPGWTNTAQLKQLGPKGIDLDLFDEECCGWQKQDPDFCGQCLIKALQEGKNGSIWVCEGDEIYQWEIPNRIEVRKNMDQCQGESKK